MSISNTAWPNVTVPPSWGSPVVNCMPIWTICVGSNVRPSVGATVLVSRVIGIQLPAVRLVELMNSDET